MKTIAFLAAALLLGAAQVIACEKDKDTQTTKSDKSKTKVSQAVPVEKATLTGSYIPRQVRRTGQTTDGPSVVFVYDQETIRRSGASDVRQFLVRRGGF